ncbi:MAG: hypothetical protein M3323_12695 [Actinomycetota bacterium]|nr:hypothetical protein [Actinomycetota bacterium]
MRRIGFALSVVGLAAALGSPAGAGPDRPETYGPKGMFCPGQLAFSSDLRGDGAGFCMYADPLIPLRLYVTHDAGASWTRAAADGIPAEASSYDTQLFLSPRFTSDRALYLQTDEGLYGSIDMGKTFDLVEERAAATGWWMRDIEPYVERAQDLEDYEKVVFAYAGGGSNSFVDDAAKIDPPVRVPVLGSPGSDLRFLVPRNFAETGTAFTLAHGGAGIACDDATYCAGTTLFECSFALVCLEQVQTFPMQFVVGAEVGTKGERTFVYLLRKSYLTDEIAGWRLRGEEETELESLRRLMPERPDAPYLQQTWARLSLDPRDPETLYLRWLACENPPDELVSVYPDLMQEAILRSTDAGETWRRVGFRREWIEGTPVSGFTRRSTGTLPWNMRDWCVPPEIAITSTGRLFVTAAYAQTDAGTTPGRMYYGPYCSVDGGREWGRSCPRNLR